MLEKAARFVEDGYILGRGGFGVVYANDAVDPDVAVKHSGQTATTCREWSSEYKKYVAMARRLEGRGVTTLSHARALAIQGYVEDTHSGGCYMFMERIKRPPEDVLARAGIAVTPESAHLTFQLQLGSVSVDMPTKSRGHFIGVEQVERILAAMGVADPAAYVAQLVEAEGELLSAIHFVGLNDAYDIELLLHFDAADPSMPIKAVFADFDQTADMFENSGRRAFDLSWALYADNIDRMEWAISAYPYFPEKSSPLWETFASSYLSFAQGIGSAEGAAAAVVLSKV